MKKTFALLCLIILLPLHALAEKDVRIGVVIYNTADTFMMSVVDALREKASKHTRIEVRNSDNDQNLQIQQVQEMIQGGVDALIINPVDRTAAVYLTRLCEKSGKPVVYINREPLKNDVKAYDKAYYVGTLPSQQGAMCGELMAEYFFEHPEADKNHDGRVQYVLLRGEPEHQDAELRSIYSVEALKKAGLQPELLAQEAGGWIKGRGQQIMAAFLSEFGDRIECVLSNNDDMALGAIDALKAAGYFSGTRFMPVVGVDATAPAREALKQGTLVGTVLNDAAAQGAAALELAEKLARGETIKSDDLLYALQDERFVYIPAEKIR